MKKLFLLVFMMVTGIIFSQEKPQLEIVGQQVKATYLYDNGKIQQVGFFKDGKLDGKWISYDEQGNVKSVAEYSNGVKTGVWMNFSNSICTNEIIFDDNKIQRVKNFNSLAKL